MANAGTRTTPSSDDEGNNRRARWNFWVLQADAVSFFWGVVFIDSATVLPLLLLRLHAAPWAIGCINSVRILAVFLPPLFAAHLIHGRPLHKRFLLGVCAIGRSALFTLAPVLWLMGGSHHRITLIWLFVTYGLFWSCDGACGVSWLDIIAKSVPARIRGRFFGTMQLLGGIVTIPAAAIISLILGSSRLPFPTDFAVLISLCSLGLLSSQIALSLIHEPIGEVEGISKGSFSTHLRRIPGFINENRTMLRYTAVRICLEVGGMAAPFYVVYARQSLQIAVAMTGIYLAFQKLGEILTGPLWGWLSERWGVVAAYRGIGLAIIAAPSIAILSNWNSLLLPATFFCLGGATQGLWMVFSNALLDSVQPSSRPLAVGVSNAMIAPTALYPLLGGIIAQSFGYFPVFGVTIAVAAVGLLLTLAFKPEPT
ncbi:MAG: MFS transporter [Armatimonadetes bacterium]|nr:MFS transporter [Armatimonadota bacterium]